MKKFRYLLALGILAIDQIVKAAIRIIMYVGESLPIIEDVFHITYVQNRGAAFSILSGQGILLVMIPLASIIFAIWYMEKHLEEHWTLTLSLSLIISGGVGNLIDRIVFGYVTDMFDFRFWPVFNVADIAVCVGAGFLILYTMAYYGKDKTGTAAKTKL